MDNSIRDSIHIMISLLVISFVIGVVMLFVNLGQSFGREQVNKIADTIGETYATELFSVEYYGAIPAPSLYLLLDKNRDAVRSLTGTAYATNIAQAEDLLKLLDRKLRIRIMNPADPLARYDIEILEE